MVHKARRLILGSLFFQDTQESLSYVRYRDVDSILDLKSYMTWILTQTYYDPRIQNPSLLVCYRSVSECQGWRAVADSPMVSGTSFKRPLKFIVHQLSEELTATTARGNLTLVRIPKPRGGYSLSVIGSSLRA